MPQRVTGRAEDGGVTQEMGGGAGQTFPGESRVRRRFLGDKDGSVENWTMWKRSALMKRRVKTAPDRTVQQGGGIWGRPLQKLKGLSSWKNVIVCPFLLKNTLAAAWRLDWRHGDPWKGYHIPGEVMESDLSQTL